MNLIKQISTDFEVMYPEAWSNHSPTKRAQIVAKVFIEDEDGLELVKHRIASRKANERQKRIEVQIKKEKAAERRKAHHAKWMEVIHKAESYYGDIVYEWCGGCGGESEEEREEVFRKIEMGEFDDEACRREALFVAFGSKVDDPNFYDKAIKYWKKRGF
jgi:hypothetical protein